MLKNKKLVKAAAIMLSGLMGAGIISTAKITAAEAAYRSSYSESERDRDIAREREEYNRRVDEINNRYNKDRQAEESKRRHEEIEKQRQEENERHNKRVQELQAEEARQREIDKERGYDRDNDRDRTERERAARENRHRVDSEEEPAEKDSKNTHSQGEVNPAAIVGAVVGAIIAKNT